MGSWKIMAILLPRIFCSPLLGNLVRSISFFPSSEKMILPLLNLAVLDNNRRIESAVTDLPDPDSPTIANISLRLTEREIFFKAEVVPDSETKSIERFFIVRRGFKFTYVTPS